MSAPDFKKTALEIHGKTGRAGAVLLTAVIFVIVFFVFWASVTEIDDVTRADGRVVPSQLIQVVQASETGTITEILVKAGDTVQAGDVLMQLDPTLVRSELDTAETEATSLRLKRARLNAQITDRPFDVTAPDNAQQMLVAERELYDALREKRDADLEVLTARREIKNAEISAANSNSLVAQENVALLAEEMAVIEPLVERRIESPLALIALRREISQQNGRTEEAANRILMAKAALLEIDNQMLARKREYLSSAHAELADVQSRLASLETRIPALRTRVARSEIRTPVSGVVNQMLFSTLGGVVQQGQTVVEIVPFGDTVTVEAFVSPDDIAFIRPDQQVKVRLTAYDSSRYGSLDGRVTRIGADTVLAPDGERSVYMVEVRLENAPTDGEGKALEVIPGMIAQIDMLSEPKTVLEYLTKPVIRVKETAFRD
jgi:membrane fusion protein, adhesin transport system